tara:strand:+ start:27 stop:218 length:192 start_codon:yes stop_codon:yes gene_type:complete
VAIPQGINHRIRVLVLDAHFFRVTSMVSIHFHHELSESENIFQDSGPSYVLILEGNEKVEGRA